MVEAGDNKRKTCATSTWSQAVEGSQRARISDLTHADWRKSSWSSFNGNCVEVAELCGGRLIGVRDTKEGGSGPILFFAEAAWRSFLDGVKSDG